MAKNKNIKVRDLKPKKDAKGGVAKMQNARAEAKLAARAVEAKAVEGVKSF
jgi:hypothetical protein